MNVVEYTHGQNLHTLEGAINGINYFINTHEISSLLDIGAGTGTWLRAAQLVGIKNVLGVDGISPEGRAFWVDRSLVRVADLRQPLYLGLRFDAVICLEVAEHLPEEYAPILIESLCRHSDLVFFSAAIPRQPGDHHINCQWPSYWQGHFNRCGFACRDDIRFRMWEDAGIEPWYRQNIFSAQRDHSIAGSEPRIASIIHPEMAPHLQKADLHPVKYARFPLKSISKRIRRLLNIC